MTGPFTPEDVARLLGIPAPTAEQSAVISAPAQPLAVIAGAGSGKSETMAARLVWLVANGHVRPDRVLGLTFTRKAAAELADRVRARLDRLRRSGLVSAEETLGDPVISTYHAYAGRMVGDHALREGLEPSMRLITPAESWQLAARIVAAYDGPMGDIGWGPPTVTAAVLALAGELSEHLRDPDGVRAVGEWLETRSAALGGRVPAYARKMQQSQRAREQLLPLVARYAAEKKTREVLDHGDQMALAARIASRHPQVGLAERSRYNVVLLDEYQDTSHAQLVLLRALFAGGHPVTAVGDPCQSIYGWRGASAGNLRRFAQDFPVLPRPFRPGMAGYPAPVKLLSTSFRNAGRVLEVAAVLQERLRAEAPDVPRLVPAPDRTGRGDVACALLDTIAAEADWAASRIAGLLALPPGTAPDGAPWPDGRDDTGPPVRHRRAVPETVTVSRAAPRARSPRHTGRGRRARRPADRARGAGRGGHAARAERRGRLGRAGPPAHRAALADRPAGPGGPGPPRPIIGAVRQKPPARQSLRTIPAPRNGGPPRRGADRPDRRGRQPGRGARRPGGRGRLLAGASAGSVRWPPSCARSAAS